MSSNLASHYESIRMLFFVPLFSLFFCAHQLDALSHRCWKSFPPKTFGEHGSVVPLKTVICIKNFLKEKHFSFLLQPLEVFKRDRIFFPMFVS